MISSTTGADMEESGFWTWLMGIIYGGDDD
jgi:hypothetical protein